MYRHRTILATSVDQLVKDGVKYINENGRRIKSRAGNALQATNVTYVLTNCRNRVHTLRYKKSIPYLATELLAYFCGSLNIYGENGYGLVNASNFWNKICDKDGMINSNYGFYCFYQNTKEGKTQLQWVREKFKENKDTRRALININSIEHKTDTKDFPCTLGILFSIENNELNCDVQSRSTDVIIGLPYDIAFFSIITELMASLLTEDLTEEIKPGYVALHATYTQIYDKTLKEAQLILSNKKIKKLQYMPIIENGKDVLKDIYNLGKKPAKTKFIQWCIKNSKRLGIDNKKNDINNNIENLV